MQLARTHRAISDETASTEPDGLAAIDAGLIELARDDPRAFAPIYERYYHPILLYCRRRLRNPDDAADATALVFTRAIGAVGRFRIDPSRPGSTVRAWLFTIARNIVLDRLRRDRPTVSLDDPNRTWHLPDRGNSPEAEVIAAEGAASVAALLEQLPERQRAVVELRFAGLTMAEICTALDLSEGAAKSLQVRAYRTLRDLVSSPTSDITRERS